MEWVSTTVASDKEKRGQKGRREERKEGKEERRREEKGERTGGVEKERETILATHGMGKYYGRQRIQAIKLLKLRFQVGEVSI
jgi:hypothetical protein